MWVGTAGQGWDTIRQQRRCAMSVWHYGSITRSSRTAATGQTYIDRRSLERFRMPRPAPFGSRQMHARRAGSMAIDRLSSTVRSRRRRSGTSVIVRGTWLESPRTSQEYVPGSRVGSSSQRARVHRFSPATISSCRPGFSHRGSCLHRRLWSCGARHLPPHKLESTGFVRIRRP
jgi:hypothetical protein